MDTCGELIPFTTGIIMQEVPTGTIDGINRIFSISTAPVQLLSLQVFVNGILQKPGAFEDYTFSGRTITFTVGATPQIGDSILAYYLR